MDVVKLNEEVRSTFRNLTEDNLNLVVSIPIKILFKVVEHEKKRKVMVTDTELTPNLQKTW